MNVHSFCVRINTSMYMYMYVCMYVCLCVFINKINSCLSNNLLSLQTHSLTKKKSLKRNIYVCVCMGM